MLQEARSRRAGQDPAPEALTRPETRSTIGNQTVASVSSHIVYGDVRGLVSGHTSEAAAFASLKRDQAGCASLGRGSYSDARVYAADGGEWVPCFDDDDDDRTWIDEGDAAEVTGGAV